MFCFPRIEKLVYSTTLYQNKSPDANESVEKVTRNISPEQSKQDGHAYEGLDSSQRGANDEAYEELDVGLQ